MTGEPHRFLQGANAFGCEGTATASVSVKPQPQAVFSTDEEMGWPIAIDISNESQSADAFDWNYGNGDTLQMESPDAIPTRTQVLMHRRTTRYSPQRALGCVDCVPDRDGSARSYCYLGSETVGCAPFETVIEYTGTEASTVAWTIDGAAADTGNAANFALNGAADSTTVHAIEIEAVSEYGCVGNAAFEVTVNPTPVVNLSASSDATCSGDAWNVIYDAQYADDINLTMNGMGLDLTTELEFTSENPS